jgi:hypothetical protein
VRIIPLRSDKEVDEIDLVSSRVEVLGRAVDNDVADPLLPLLFPFTLARFVDEFDRDNILPNIES